MINLSFRNIIDEIFALTALRCRVDPAANPATSVLDRDNLPALRIIVQSAFSSMVERLLPFIADASTDPDYPGAEHPYNSAEGMAMLLDFGKYVEGFSNGSLLMLRRRLEHLVACLTLSRIFTDNASIESETTSFCDSIIDLLCLDQSPKPLQITPSR